TEARQVQSGIGEEDQFRRAFLFEERDGWAGRNDPVGGAGEILSDLCVRIDVEEIEVLLREPARGQECRYERRLERTRRVDDFLAPEVLRPRDRRILGYHEAGVAGAEETGDRDELHSFAARNRHVGKCRVAYV